MNNTARKKKSPRILVFQHIDIEHPGIFRDFLAEDNIAWDAVELDEGEAIPDLAGYDALWVMGGPMDVWEEDEHPWLVSEKAAIREAVLELKMPYFGVCLGHQLLASALGGSVGASATPEVGILEIELTEAGQRSPFMTGVPSPSPCLQWHSAEVQSLPENFQVLASSEACVMQAISYDDVAFGVQYHVELTPNTIGDWHEVPAYKQALHNTLGDHAIDTFVGEANRLMPTFNRDARKLYDNVMSVLASTL